MPEFISNPVAHLHKLDPPVPPKRRALQKEQARIQKRIAKFEAQRAQEESMAGAPGMQMIDMPDSKPAQQRLIRKPIPQNAGQTAPVSVNRAAVQRVERPAVVAPDPQHDILQELQSEFGPGAQAADVQADSAEGAPTPVSGQAPPAGDTDDEAENIAAILKRFKGSPDDIAKQLAKSYSHAEKRVRKLEQEKSLLMHPPTPPAAPAPSPAPIVVPQQTQVVPEFNYKRVKEEILDKGDEIFKEFEGHVTQRVDQKLAQLVGPLYNEALDNRLFRKFGDVVTEENLDVIKAMAQREPGDTPWDKLQSAVAKYRQAMPTRVATPNAEVKVMEDAAKSPAPKARATSGDKKMWKASDLRKVMQRPEYRYDLQLRSMVDRAYAEGRVMRDQ